MKKSARGQCEGLHTSIEERLKLRLELGRRGAGYNDLFVSRALEKIHRLRKIGDGFDEALLVWRDENVLARELLEQGCRFAEILRQNATRFGTSITTRII